MVTKVITVTKVMIFHGTETVPKQATRLAMECMANKLKSKSRGAYRVTRHSILSQKDASKKIEILL